MTTGDFKKSIFSNILDHFKRSTEPGSPLPKPTPKPLNPKPTVHDLMMAVGEGIMTVNEARKQINEARKVLYGGIGHSPVATINLVEIRHRIPYIQLGSLIGADIALVNILRSRGMPVIFANGRIEALNGTFGWIDSGNVREFVWRGSNALSAEEKAAASSTSPAYGPPLYAPIDPNYQPQLTTSCGMSLIDPNYQHITNAISSLAVPLPSPELDKLEKRAKSDVEAKIQDLLSPEQRAEKYRVKDNVERDITFEE